MKFTRASNPKVFLHPQTVKQIRQGHPWILKDKYTEKFPVKAKFLIGLNSQKKQIGLFLNDPEHPKIKARLWSKTPPFNTNTDQFYEQLKQRLELAWQKRPKENIAKYRNHFFWVFAEADQLPGLKILVLNDSLLLQYESQFWQQFHVMLTELIMSIVQNQIEIKRMWVQNRWNSKKFEFEKVFPLGEDNNPLIVTEAGLHFSLQMNRYYDIGLYTDMAKTRQRIFPLLGNAESVLNLYCYTGVFSLLALKAGAKKVCSVDISETYLNWLIENIKLNPQLDDQNHFTLKKATNKLCMTLANKGSKFDFIICDPPTFASDGQKGRLAFKEYQKLLPTFLQLRAAKGKILVFLNTHIVTMDKFKNLISSILVKENAPLKIVQTFGLEEDCPRIPGFPEGSYLKGILLAEK